MSPKMLTQKKLDERKIRHGQNGTIGWAHFIKKKRLDFKQYYYASCIQAQSKSISKKFIQWDLL